MVSLKNDHQNQTKKPPHFKGDHQDLCQGLLLTARALSGRPAGVGHFLLWLLALHLPRLTPIFALEARPGVIAPGPCRRPGPWPLLLRRSDFPLARKGDPMGRYNYEKVKENEVLCQEKRSGPIKKITAASRCGRTRRLAGGVMISLDNEHWAILSPG